MIDRAMRNIQDRKNNLNKVLIENNIKSSNIHKQIKKQGYLGQIEKKNVTTYTK